MTHRTVMPVGMGIVMGVMAMAMLHAMLTGDGSGGLTGALFLLAHVAVLALAAVGVAFGLHRRWPLLSRVLANRPSRRHLGTMLGVAIASAALNHIVHGAPTWI